MKWAIYLITQSFKKYLRIAYQKVDTFSRNNSRIVMALQAGGCILDSKISHSAGMLLTEFMKATGKRMELIHKIEHTSYALRHI